MAWRMALVAFGCVIVQHVGFAQAPLPSGALTQTPLPSGALQQTTLPSASLPARSPDNSMPPARADVFVARPDTYAPRSDRQVVPDPRFVPYGIGGGVAVYGWPSWDGARRGSSRGDEKGYLQLDVQPQTAHVYVDGLYVGTVDDVRNTLPGRSLSPGPHRLELRATGYEGLTVDVSVSPDEAVTYRGALEPVAAAAPQQAVTSRAPTAAPKTFYVISGCYAGDRPPRAVRLPARCDARQMRTIPPVVQTARRSR